jgi:hypothetical protein
MLKFVPCKKPTSDSQKAHYFQWWIQVQDWETGFFGVQTLETELNFIALLSEYLYTNYYMGSTKIYLVTGSSE